MVFHAQKHIPTTIVPVTSVQDFNPRPCADNVHTSVLPFEILTEMTVIETDDDEIPTRKLTWKPSATRYTLGVYFRVLSAIILIIVLV